jgi:(1->4)-alpha-D-glucan 1-alpha-D-glucosylmutase
MRARLLALSHRPQDWSAAVTSWQTVTTPHLGTVEGAQAPDANDQFMLLQALLGAWPIELLDEQSDSKAVAGFRARMEAHLVKSLREAKLHTSWVNPNSAYEEAALALLRRLIEPGSRFFEVFGPLARRIDIIGMTIGLARTALKCTLPGMPDIYQGTELWDLSLVDPDNRRPVDYGLRIRSLEKEIGADLCPRSWRDGRMKQHLLARILRDRAMAPALYAEGDYCPIVARGERANQALAFRRSHGRERLVVAVARLLGTGMTGEELPSGEHYWGDTKLPLAAGSWRDVASGRHVEVSGGCCRIAEIFELGPVAVLRTMQ